jgi:hypothetical protein
MYKSNLKDNSREQAFFASNLKYGVWLLGIIAWIFAILERIIAAFTDNYLSSLATIQLLGTCFFFLIWFYLKPEKISYKYIVNSQDKITSLRKRHIISQEYILPYSHLCQIYHLLNLKHLETIHRFSLNNLRIVSINHSQPTSQGGIIKFQTALDSPINALRIWRQEQVEVDLTLHNPYTVELSVPVYNDKRVNVVFNVLPITKNEHYFFIDIYSNLQWFKPLLQILFHCAACLTLFEDLGYLNAIAERNVAKLFHAGKSSNHKNMYLYNRFVELYGSHTQIPPV